MPTYKLTVAYDGTDFAGWQKQEPPDPASSVPGGPRHSPVRTEKLEPGLVAGKPGRIALRTVQAVLERAVREVVREPVLVRGASRTDAGVHARSQVAVFSCSGERRSGEAGTEGGTPAGVGGRGEGGWPIERGLDRLLRAVNSRLPDDVQVVRVETVGAGFDPILDCTAKGYSYTFWESMHRPLWGRRSMWHTWADLDLDAMRRGAAHIVGERDFNAFAAVGHGRENSVRTVYECTLRELPADAVGLAAPSRVPDTTGASSTFAEADAARIIRMEISGNGFLYNMVRIIAGTLHDVGRGHTSPDRIPEILASRNRHVAGPTLPPQGLCLEWVRYAEPPEPCA